MIEMLRATLSLSAAPSVLARADGSFLYANPAACALFGRSLDDVLRGSWQTVTHPDDLAGNRSHVVAMLAGTLDSFHERKRYVRADGRDVWADVTVTCIRDGAGEFVCFWGLIIDVDAEVRASLALQESQARLEGVLQSELDGHVLLDAVRDERGHIVDFTYAEVNPVACNLLGRSREDLIGRRLTEVSPDTAASGRLDAYAQVVQTGEPVQWSGAPLSASAVPSIEFVDAQIIRVGDGVSYSFRDATERVLTQQALQESEERLRLILENSRDVQLQARMDGVIEFVSPAIRDVLGWDPEDLIGQTPAAFMHPEDLALLREAGQRLQAGQAPTRIGRLRRKDGTYAWIESVMSPVLDEDGQPVSRIASWRDVGDRVKAAERLVEAEERYRLLAENSSDAVFSASPDAVFTYVSPSVTGLLGWQPDDMVGCTPVDFMHPDDVPVMQEQVARVGHGHPVAFRARFRTADDSYRWISATVSPVLDGSGAVIERIGSWRNAETEVAAEQALTTERDRLRATLDVELDPHVTLRAVRNEDDTIVDFEFIDANAVALTYMDIDATGLTGALLTSMYPSDAGRILIAEYAHVVSTGEPIVDDEYVYPNERLAGAVRTYALRAAKLGDGLSVVWRDVTEHQTMVRALADSEERFRLLAENSTDVVLLTADMDVVWVSPSLTEQLGWQPSDWIGHNPGDFLHPDDRERLERQGVDDFRTRAIVQRSRIRDAAGVYHWVESHSGPHRSKGGTVTGIVASFRVVDDQVTLEEQLDRLARTDPTTGLINSREAMAQIHGLAGRTPRTGTRIALLFCDIDLFKDINDTYGHPAGDTVLRELATRLCGAVRTDDIVARIGGDELLITLTGVHDLDEAHAIAEKIRSTAAEPITTEAGTVTATLSIGVTLLHPGETPDDLVSRADAAMYEAKRAGRNRVTTLA